MGRPSHAPSRRPQYRPRTARHRPRGRRARGARVRWTRTGDQRSRADRGRPHPRLARPATRSCPRSGGCVAPRHGAAAGGLRGGPGRPVRGGPRHARCCRLHRRFGRGVLRAGGHATVAQRDPDARAVGDRVHAGRHRPSLAHSPTGAPRDSAPVARVDRRARARARASGPARDDLRGAVRVGRSDLPSGDGRPARVPDRHR